MQNKLLAALAALLTVSSVIADDNPIEANMTLSTDYVWRGYSQTLGSPAISGGLDYAADNGFYIGTWASNVDFASPANMEHDVYLGWGTELTNGLGLGIDLGFLQYFYYDESDADFNEIYAGLSHSGFSGTVYRDFDNKNSYFDLGYEYEFSNGVGLGVHYGVNSFDDSESDYDDYSVTVSKSYLGLDFGLGYYDNDIDTPADLTADEDDLFDDIFGGRVVFSVGKSF